MRQLQESDIELSIIVKTLNEEKNIARCIEAILTSLHDISVEIIVADSGSNDRTVDIAASYPVTIVQLANPAERSCGIGPQLGFQHSHGRYVLILDADMVLHSEFVKNALIRMKDDARCGGIGGQLVECAGTGYEYELRRSLCNEKEEEVKWLDGCGLYRRAAIESVGYLTNRNLHAYEEKELGLRLTHAGWHLYRLSEIAVDHYGHSISTLKLLVRRWKSGYADASGESIRACIGKSYFLKMITAHKAIATFAVLDLLFLVALLISPWSTKLLFLLSMSTLIGFLMQAFRKRSFVAAIYSILHLFIFSIGMLKGLIRDQKDPLMSIESVILKTS